jgi:DNA-binding transcriptional LysR family regulator|tara:strand:+ start:555 stop:764 length:210 start_codon:yes stop_codon:yes gene_type:complete
MMLTLVGAGYGIGFTTTTRITAYQRSDVVIRPLAVESAVITTYLLWPENTRLSVPLEQFIARLRDRLSD